VKRYVLSAGAELDLEAIWDYIAQDKIGAADRWIDKRYDAFEKLSQSPGMGRTRPDLTGLPVRFWGVGDYLIVYRVQENCIEIIAVTQGSRDIPTFLSERGS